ncbi:chitin synthase chs-2-like [Cynoglossus semilaevis]|uniref:chitin synthase chs-2-like n=1 Tax=Cynoglossus semilaevis TaxID=244447 RepID=UPI000D62E63E|nr:chitin synthase chs-2-like [Cynoglossus semilaevis]
MLNLTPPATAARSMLQESRRRGVDGSLLVLSTLSSPTSMRNPKEKQFYMLMLVFCLEPDDVSIIETPYGGRLMVVMPEGNMLGIHLKDKSLIRNKKRWSQIMYLYYLLGWKGYMAKNPSAMPREMNPSTTSLFSMNGESFVLPHHDNDHKRKFISDENTYLLALDGDTDFHPKAVILLVDRGYKCVCCYRERISSENVLINVCPFVHLCWTVTSLHVMCSSPGEDRWLCTLLLQQGWRVEYNAASDVYTNSPQEFKEFYNQRRRWGPSTLAHTLDLLHSGKETVKKNTSISTFYIFYQMFAVCSSILGPASVTLMIAGKFNCSYLSFFLVVRFLLRFKLRNKKYSDVCDDLVAMLTDTLNTHLNGERPEDVLTSGQLEELEYSLTEQARRILKTSKMNKLEKRVITAIEKTLTAPLVPRLEEGEQDFWDKLIKRYLKPIVNTEAHEEEVTRELKSLRNKVVFLYFIINVLWVVATFFLQAIGNDVISIKIPKFFPNGTQSGEYLKVEPLSLMFLLSFAVLLLIQFLAMLYHRIYTLIHVVSYRSAEKNYRAREDDKEEEEEGMVMENIITLTSDDL